MRRKQDWTPGNKVSAGFMRDMLVVAIAGRERLLMSGKGKLYSFIPHEGCCEIGRAEARRLYSSATARIER